MQELTDGDTWPLTGIWLESCECCAFCSEPSVTCTWPPASPARSTAGRATDPTLAWPTRALWCWMIVALQPSNSTLSTTTIQQPPFCGHCTEHRGTTRKKTEATGIVIIARFLEINLNIWWAQVMHTKILVFYVTADDTWLVIYDDLFRSNQSQHSCFAMTG